MEKERDEKKKASEFYLDDKRFDEIEKMIDETVGLYKNHPSMNLIENIPTTSPMENNIHEETPSPIIKPEIRKPERKIYPRNPFKFPKIRVRPKREIKDSNHIQSIKMEGSDKKYDKDIKTLYNQQTDLKSKNSTEEKTKTVGSRTLLDEDIKKLLVIMDDLLGELPEDIIKKFVESDDFLLYERVMKKYNIK